MDLFQLIDNNPLLFFFSYVLFLLFFYFLLGALVSAFLTYKLALIGVTVVNDEEFSLEE